MHSDITIHSDRVLHSNKTMYNDSYIHIFRTILSDIVTGLFTVTRLYRTMHCRLFGICLVTWIYRVI